MSIIVSFRTGELQKRSTLKKDCRKQCNLELSSRMKTNVKNVKKRILVISKSDTWNVICPHCLIKPSPLGIMKYNHLSDPRITDTPY